MFLVNSHTKIRGRTNNGMDRYQTARTALIGLIFGASSPRRPETRSSTMLDKSIERISPNIN